MVDFCSELEGLSEARCSGWEQHELLEGKLVACVLSSVDDVKRRDWKDVLFGSIAGKLGQMLVKRDLSC